MKKLSRNMKQLELVMMDSYGAERVCPTWQLGDRVELIGKPIGLTLATAKGTITELDPDGWHIITLDEPAEDVDSGWLLSRVRYAADNLKAIEDTRRMKLIIAGSRTITDAQIVRDAITKFVQQYGMPSEVVSGTADGPDTLGEHWAKRNGVQIKRFPADWSLGKKAGPIRNKQMAEYADALLAIYDGDSKGTANMIQEAQNRGLLVMVYSVNVAELQVPQTPFGDGTMKEDSTAETHDTIS